MSGSGTSISFAPTPAEATATTGPEARTVEGWTARRLPEYHDRRYVSIFGELTIARVAYGSREGQKIERVPLDERLGLPEGDFSYVLEDWGRRLCLKGSFAEAGRSVVALVSGDAGVGKSRLVAEATQLAAGRGFTVLSGQCAELGDSVRHRVIPVDYASHSAHVDELRDEILTALRGIEPRETRVPMVSSLTGEWLSGPEMVEWGLALRSVPRDGLEAEVERLLGLLRGRSRPAMAVVKQLVQAPRTMSFEEGLRYERELFSRLHEQDPEVGEGYHAFVEKRTPSWRDVDARAYR